VASHLYETERLIKALPFYEPLRRQEDLLDATALYRAGKCYLEIGDKRQAEECFTAALDSEETPLDTRINTRFELAKMYEAARKNTEALYLLEEAMGIERERDQGIADSARQQDQERSRPNVTRKLAPKASGEATTRARKPTGPRKRREPGAKPKDRVSRPRPLLFALDEDRRLEEERRSAYIAEKWRTVREGRQDSEEGPGETWMDAAKELIDDFRSYKGFYPWDRYLMQMGLRKDDTKPSSTNPHLLKMAQRLRDGKGNCELVVVLMLTAL
jgi:general transcription factor 3C polypeptide 3 (transcription factor C subunit 4)